ncbi:hypothetical protein DP144_14070 [Clostridium tetani]|uniref:hypothetical protein n=1 Tax=Clostridium tetani TaxID=1513 RepID=UPI00100BADB7|nr:hypothetical protein [Clostridium tetani]RXM73551.1 hypothetical protein DP154_14045 [Clostridium tetani]RYU97784.1 hypothetical protein DP144_14070 [Clostridium tetani]
MSVDVVEIAQEVIFMDKSRAKEIAKEIIDTCNQYTDCKNCPFYNMLEYPTDCCIFGDSPDDSNWIIKE